jgi:putative protein kinase ArgK-like GTPase of G3E family
MVKPIEPETTRNAKIIEVIQTISVRGNGVDTVHREVIQYWTKEGKILAEKDPCENDEMDKLKKVTILQLAQQLEDVLTHDLVDENTSVAEFLKHYLNN